MRYIAAPWRTDYVRTVETTKGCAFCRALKAPDDREASILFRGAHSFVILNKFPYVSGHVMIAPVAHRASYDRSSAALTAEISELLKTTIRILKAAYRPQGFNIGMNLGRSAGAGVVGHYHLHVVPRWAGDANFMPIVGETKVVLEDLATTYARLRPLFDRARGPKR
jgi:ATP adenylyltransferase